MLLFKYLLIFTGYGLIVWSLATVSKNLYKVVQYHRQLRKASPESQPEKPRLNWTTAKWALPAAWLPILIASGIVVVPSGMGGVRVSQASGTRPGTLYPGVHVVTPLVESVALYDTRDQVLTTASSKDGVEASSKKKDTTGKGESDEKKPEVFTVQSKEGLSIGMAITVRYRLDPKRLDFIHANLPHPVEKEIVPPVVATVFRELAPNYSVREIFATKREEIRQAASARLVEKLGPDGIIVKEVMLRDIQLPVEYAKGLEGLLLKEQEDEQMGVETDMKAKQVRIAELEAEAQKIQQVKHAEGDGQVKVLQAKSEADAMQYTLPLKEKQIQQSRLEAEARKEATVKNAEAQAEAKVIDSKAEMQRRTLLADAEAVRIRKIASADSERMKSEADVLKGNPLLINKIVAERLSDKLQIMMVPSDAKIFFNDVMKGGITPQVMDGEEDSQSAQGEEDDPNAEDQENKTQTPRPIKTHRTVSRR
ncbi:MAG TPA: SPFH domain-containing protein [Candidatus Angelobacter sp.]|jgi:regulator of protease activity HflC (stomatin/prohibitin superfamily)|nr:SPFH domain-containing protein [Candidatus Angelobacter sp.]